MAGVGGVVGAEKLGAAGDDTAVLEDAANVLAVVVVDLEPVAGAVTADLLFVAEAVEGSEDRRFMDCLRATIHRDSRRLSGDCSEKDSGPLAVRPANQR